MHQWTSSTYKSLCGVPEANVPNWLEEEGFLWQTILPRDGLKHPFLMHGFLALAALELASLGINPSVDYVSAALEYHDIALAGFRSELVNVTPDNQQALIACSLITGLLSLTLPHFTKSRNVPQSMVTNMVVHYRLICGLATLISQNIDGKMSLCRLPYTSVSPSHGNATNVMRPVLAFNYSRLIKTQVR